jgi:hypothetical protein
MRILTCSICLAPVRHVTPDEAAVLALSDGDLPSVDAECVWHAGIDWAVLARLLDCETSAPVLMLGRTGGLETGLGCRPATGPEREETGMEED